MRNNLKILLPCLLALSLLACSRKAMPVQLNVMSMNIWKGGGKSVGATGEVFLKSKADIIGVQEAFQGDKNTAAHLADSLGWHSYAYDRTATIISKYPIVDTSANKHGVKIKIDDKHFVWMFNVHLIHCPYEAYQLNNISYCGAPMLSTATEAVASAQKSRGDAVNSNISDILTAQKEGYPVFLTGDFNEPSCLDWTAKAVAAGLCKMAIQWPSTKAFIDKGGLKDSYRTYHPDEVTMPGHTWTTLPETTAYTEVLDRIDFVFYSGEKMGLEKSLIIGEKSTKSDIGFDNYPSDHRAVISTFLIK